MAKSNIVLSAERNIRTAEFEGLRVHAQVNEDIEWADETERDIKVAGVIEHLKKDFIKSYNTIIKSIGEDRCIGVGNLLKNNKKVNTAKVTTDDEDEIDLF